MQPSSCENSIKWLFVLPTVLGIADFPWPFLAVHTPLLREEHFSFSFENSLSRAGVGLLASVNWSRNDSTTQTGSMCLCHIWRWDSGSYRPSSHPMSGKPCKACERCGVCLSHELVFIDKDVGENNEKREIVREGRRVREVCQCLTESPFFLLTPREP